MFVDNAELEVRAGDGGDGRLSFRHEKYRAYGGPDGGDGGIGGSVIFVGDHNAHTLSKFRTARSVEAKSGEQGGANRRHGKAGEDVHVRVPVGTQVIANDEVLVDLTKPGQEFVIAKGGRGGFGNAHFTSSTRQAPKIAEKGEKGDYRHVQLELKLVADVGLVGLPNAGKSTFLSVVSNAKPKIADYAFTTLTPNLGVVAVDDTDLVIADIPGLIEGASQGKGLGDEFLRHVERTAVLLHLVDGTSETVADDYKTIVAELKDYGHGLDKKPRVVVLSKTDGLDAEQLKARKAELKKVAKTTVLTMSAVSGDQVQTVLRGLVKLVTKAREAAAIQAEEDAVPVFDKIPEANEWHVAVKPDNHYRVSGARIEGFGRRTDWDNPDAVQRLRAIMQKMGVASKLKKLGAEPGAIIELGEHELELL